MSFLPPFTLTARHVIFFMASWGVTQGPPVLLQPGELGMAIVMPSESAMCTA